MTTEPEALSPQEVLARSSVADKPGLYVLGCFAKRVTMYAQQVRAVNLAVALILENKIPAKGRVAIVGGGAAGLTLAASLAMKVSDIENVDVFETTPSLLHQQQTSNRYLHPNLYDWPASHATNDDAELPVLNWQANEASAVREQLLDAFNGELQVHRNLFIHYDKEVVEVRQNPIAGYRLVLTGNEQPTMSYNLVVIAIGIGYEVMNETNALSYWDPASYEGPLKKRGPARILISGNGDGGLVDFMMLAFVNNSHRELLDKIANYCSGNSLQERILAIEKRVWLEPNNVNLAREYWKLFQEDIGLKTALVDAESMLRPNAEIIWHINSNRILNRNSAIINRIGAMLAFLTDKNAQRNKISIINKPARITKPADLLALGLPSVDWNDPTIRILRFGSDRSINLAPFSGLLCQDGQSLIDGVQRRDDELPALATFVRAFFGSDDSTSHDTRDAQARMTAYLRWIAYRNANVFLPGSGTPVGVTTLERDIVPVFESDVHTSHAIAKLKETIANMKEWSQSSSSKSSYSYRDLLDVSGNSVVLSGPGSGKSTMCQALAVTAAGQRRSILFIKLGQLNVAALRTSPGDDQIIELALSGYSSSERIRGELDHPDVLIADGLDECGENAAVVAEYLAIWAARHSRTKVIITSRPAGYAPGPFLRWSHYELLALQEKAIDRLEKAIVASLVPADEQPRVHKTLELLYGTNSSAYRLKSNALLLSLMIQLAANIEEVPRSRTNLFAQILAGIPVLNARYRVAQASPEKALACLEVVAACLQGVVYISAAPTRSDIVIEVSKMLRVVFSLPADEATQVAHDSLSYWINQRLVGQFTSGGIDILSFPLVAFREYLAACHLRRSGEDAAADYVKKNAERPGQREVILHAAEIIGPEPILDAILASPSFNNPWSTAPTLAATILQDSLVDVRQPLVGAIVKKLLDHMALDVPLLAYEAAGALAPLAANIHEIEISRFVASGMSSSVPWIYISAHRLNTELPDGRFDIEQFRSFLSNFVHTVGTQKESGSSLATHGRGSLCEQALIRGAIRLASPLLSEPFAEVIERIVNDGTGISMYTSMVILPLLPPEARNRIEEARAAKFLSAKESGLFDPFRIFHDLEAVARLVETAFSHPGISPLQGEDQNYTDLRRLITSIGFWESDWHEATRLVNGGDRTTVLRVIEALGMLLGLDGRKLHAQAGQVATLLRASPSLKVADLIAELPERYTVVAASSVRVSSDILISGLLHSSDCVFTATKILVEARCYDQDFKQRIYDEFRADKITRLLPVAKTLWSDAAIDVILGRIDIEALRPEDAWIVSALPELNRHQASPNLDVTVGQALSSDLPPLVIAASEALADIQGGLMPNSDRSLSAALEEWTQRDVDCDRCRVPVGQQYSCPKCHIVPPHPLPNLISCASKRLVLDVELLYPLLNHYRSDVFKATADALTAIASDDLQVLGRLLAGIGAGTYASRSLEIVFRFPDRLSIYRDRVLDMLESHSVESRQAVTRALASFDWLDRETAVALCERRLVDPAPNIRNAAIRTIRTLGAT